MAFRADYKLQPEPGLAARSLPGVRAQGAAPGHHGSLGEGQRVITVRRCRFCKAEWHDGERISQR